MVDKLIGSMGEEMAQTLRVIIIRNGPQTDVRDLAQACAAIAQKRVKDAWREGWALCKSSLTDDEQFCLTEDVEEDAWRDSKARAALPTMLKGNGE